MNTIKAITVGLLSIFAVSQTRGQVVVKEKNYSPYYYKEPKYKIKDKDGIPVIKTKDYGGYTKNKRYYYDNGHNLYYYWEGNRKVYYNRGWRPY
jgi:hypothetical protein